MSTYRTPNDIADIVGLMRDLRPYDDAVVVTPTNSVC